MNSSAFFARNSSNESFDESIDTKLSNWITKIISNENESISIECQIMMILNNSLNLTDLLHRTENVESKSIDRITKELFDSLSQTDRDPSKYLEPKKSLDRNTIANEFYYFSLLVAKTIKRRRR